MTEETTEGLLKPPYVGWQTFETVLSKIRDRNPTDITREKLKSWSVTPSNAGKVLPALKFLGIIGNDHKPNAATWQRLTKQGAEYQRALKELTTAAYKQLFDHFTDIEQQTFTDIESAIQDIWKTSAASRDEATRFFIKLCSAAGIVLHASAQTRKVRPPNEEGAARETQPSAKRAARLPAVKHRHVTSNSFPLTFTVQLTGQENEAQLEQFLACFKRAYDKVFGQTT
jgi:hypothetical protein